MEPDMQTENSIDSDAIELQVKVDNSSVKQRVARPARMSSTKMISTKNMISTKRRPTDLINSDALDSPIKNQDRWIENRPTASHLRQRQTCQGPSVFSLFNKQFYFPKNHSDEFIKMFFAWVYVTLLAVLVSIAALFIDFGVVLIRYCVYGVSQSLFLDEYRNHSDGVPTSIMGASFSAFAAMCAIFALCASLLVVLVSILAQSSGLPETKSYLNGVHLEGLFSTKTMAAKALGTMFSIGSGLVAGKEGPIIHIGAILGAAISQGSSKLFGFRFSDDIAKHYRSAEWKRDFAVLGSAMGVSAAFISPMGGVLFAIEEGATVWRQQLTFFALYGSCLTSFIVGSVQAIVRHPDVSPVVPEVVYGSYRNIADHLIFRAKDFPYVFLVGIIGGVFGSVFPLLQKKLKYFRTHYIRTSRFRTIAEVLFVSVFISSGRFWLPYLLSSCSGHDTSHAYHEAQQGHTPLWDTAPDASSFNCPNDEGNDLGYLLWVPMDSAIKFVLHGEGEGLISTANLFLALAFYFICTLMVFGTAVPSGLFIPAFMIGSLYGRLVGQLQAFMTGDATLLTAYAFLGAASALGGVTRVTISVALIALESTQNFSSSFYCYVVVIIAKLVADSINLGIYDNIIEAMNVPFLVDELGFEVTRGYQLTMGDIMHKISDGTEKNEAHVQESKVESSKQDLAAGFQMQKDEVFVMPKIKAVDSVDNVMLAMQNYRTATEFLCVTDTGGLAGVVERIVLLRLIDHGLFGSDADLLDPGQIDSAYPNLRTMINTNDENIIFESIWELPGSERTQLVVDCRPYMDLEPPIVLQHSCLRKAHAFLRQGERNVLVAVPESINVVGVVTRHDLMPGCLGAVAHAKKEYLNIESRDRARQQEAKEHNVVRTVSDAELLQIITAEKVKRDLVAGKAQFAEASEISPFEPRFYELLYAYFQSHDVYSRKLETASHKIRHSSSPVRLRSDSSNSLETEMVERKALRYSALELV